MSQRPAPLSGSGAPARSGALAAILSFFIPGLGNVYAGQRLRGLLIAIPGNIVVVLVAYIALTDKIGLAGLFLTSGYAFAVLFVLFLVYRTWAIIDAYRVAVSIGSSHSTRGALAAGIVALVVLLVVNTSVVGSGAYISWDTQYNIDRVTTQNCNGADPVALRSHNCPTNVAVAPTGTPQATGTGQPTSGDTSSPGDTLNPCIDPNNPDCTGPAPDSPLPVPSDLPSPTPAPTVCAGCHYWATDGVLNVLLLGYDAGAGGSRNSGLRTDTMMVLSIDIKTGRSALYGIPRNVLNAPLPDDLIAGPCHCFRPYLTGLGTVFLDGDVKSTTGSTDPFAAIRDTIANILGLNIDGIVTVNLEGFVEAVDALGGVTVNVPPPGVVDTQYRDENNNRVNIDIKPGIQHMDGHTALEFVRSRHQDSDYFRMARQQLFLRALQQQMTACNLIPRLPALLSAVGDAVRTDFPASEFPALLDLVSRTKQPRRFEFTPPNYPEDWSTPGVIAKIQYAVTQGFAATPGNPDPAEPDESLPPPPAQSC